MDYLKIGYYRWDKVNTKIGRDKGVRLSQIIQWLYSEDCKGYWVINADPNSDFALIRLSDPNTALLFRLKWT
ncbi:MAG: hypothetical protein EOP84_14085 [Verrucomicrobiaceae bacterium]|nr:MAG: hypothetical protein EOP84_14085 [Verrucomicrobiaceae bacterium]